MFGFPVLEFFLSIVFIFLLFSMFSSWIVEALSRLMNWRGKFLQSKLKEIMNRGTQEDLYSKLVDHPLIDGLSASKDKPTSNIPPKIFAKAVVDVVPTPLPDSGTLNETLLSLQKESIDRKEYLGNVAEWFEAYMDRVSTWYKQRLRVKLLVAGIVMAVALNVDTIRIMKTMWTDAQAREVVVADADAFSASSENLESADQKQIVKVDEAYPIGWTDDPIDSEGLPLKILGLLISGFIVTLGAPFWFDVLKKITSFRSPSSS